MKKILPLLLAAILLMLCLSACNPNNGTYYLYKDGKLDETSYFTLNGEQWENQRGQQGRYEIADGKITLYSVFNGVEKKLMSGTIEDGVVTLSAQGMTSVYCLKGKQPQA